EPVRRLRVPGDRGRSVLSGGALWRGRGLAPDVIGEPGLLSANHRRGGGQGLAPRPVDGVEIEPGCAVDVDAPVLEAVHSGEREEPDLSQEGLGQALRGEHDARRPAVSATLSRPETPDALAVLERPRVALADPEEHRVAASDAA